MTPPLPEHERLFELLAGWCDGTLGEAEVAQLDGLLRSDPELQKFYVAYMDQHAILTADLIPIAAPLLTEEFIRSLGHESGAVEGGLATAGAGDAAVRLRPARWARTASRSWRWLAAAAATLLLVGLITQAVWLWARRGAPVVAELPPRAVRRRVAPAEALAMVVRLERVEWEPGGGRTPSEGDALPASRLDLRSGRCTLAMLNGVTLTLEGRVDLELVSVDQVVCHRGKVRARVPAGAEEFIISTPGSDVADLGTDFGVNVDADGKTRVMVFQGLADVAVFDASGSSQRNRSVSERGALEIDPRGLRIDAIEAEPERFLTPPVLTIPRLALAPSYRDVVLEARPWGYWRCESLDGGRISNEVVGRLPLRATGPVRLTGVGNRSAAFGPEEVEQYLLMDGLWKPPRDPGYAVELWFSTERIGVAALAGLFVPRGGSGYDHIFLLELTARESHSILFRRPSVRFLHRWPPGWQGGDNLLFNFYVPYRWHHVVAQTVGDRMELYLDGTPLPPLSVSPDRATEACQFIVGRLKPLPRLAGLWEVRPFVGQVDEIALYDHPLSSEEVRRHHALRITADRPSEP